MQGTRHWSWPAPLAWAEAARRWAPVALLLVTVALAYAPAVPSFFTSDDLDMLAGDAADLFSPASGFGRFMPLAAGVHRATAMWSGLDPVPAHTLQLALHGVCALLVYALVRELGGDRAVALAAAVLFALYPRQHQVVMWFGAVSLGLAAALSLAAAWCFVRAWRDPAARVGWAAVACYAAALLAHESAVALPLVFGTLAMFESRRPGQGLPRPVPPWLWAGVAVLVAHLGLLAWAYRVRAATYPDNGYRFLGFGGDLFVAPARYAAQLVVPPPMTEPLALGEAGPWLGLAAVLGAAWWAWRGDRWVRLGLAWLALAALPYVLFGVYGVADRYYYFPSVGLALVVASVLMRRGRWGTTVLALYAMASMLLLGQAADEWRAAGATARATMDTLGRWAGGSAEGASAEAALFVGVPFKQSTRWPGSQVYVFSTGIVGAAHLATGWPRLQVSYVFGDEQPTLGRRLAALSPTGGPPGLYLFDLGVEPVADLSGVVGAALPELAALHWHGASRTPVDWQRYVGQPVPWDRSESVAARGGEPPGGPMAPGGP